MHPRVSSERPGPRWAWGLALAVALSTPAPAVGAETLTLSNPRLEPDPVETYGRLTLRMEYSGAKAPVVRLWSRSARESSQAELVPIEIRPEAAAPSGKLFRTWELGEPAPRTISIFAEDARGERSAPLELRFTVVEPPRRLEEVTYLSDGLKIKGHLYRPARAEPFPVVIVSHGSRERGELTQPNRYEWLSYRLARLGYLTFAPERRGYGGSDGEGVVGGAGGFRSLQYGVPGEVKDVLAAIDFLKERPDVDGKRIVLVGKSLGGLVSLLIAAERPELRAVVSLAGGFGIGARMMGPEMAFVEGELQSAVRRIQIPTLVMHVENDRIVPVQFSRLVHEGLQKRGIPAVAKIYPPFKVAGKEREGHALFDGVDGFSYFWKDLTGYLADVLKP